MSSDRYGSGYGFGCGFGCGYGSEVATVCDCPILLVPGPWAVVKIGCEVGTLAWWREHWQGVARKHCIPVSAINAESIFERIN